MMDGSRVEAVPCDFGNADRRRHRRKVSSSASAASSSAITGDSCSTGDGPRATAPVTPELRRAVTVAGEDIPAGTRSPEMMADTPIDVGSVFWGDIDAADPLITIFLKNGKMTSATCDVSWMQHVRLAQHCHMQNMQIIQGDQDSFCLEASRTIRRGEPLYVWFTLETAKYFRIPFLSLVNIQGGCQYKCHQCGRVYKDPNPLKIHLAFYCVTSDSDPTSVQDDSSSTHLPSFPSVPSQLATPGAKRRASAFRPPTSKSRSVCELTTSSSTISSPFSLPVSTSGHAPAASQTQTTPLKSWPNLHRMAPIMVYPTGHVHFPGSTPMNLYPSAAWLSASGLQSTSAPPCDNLVTCSPYLALPNLLNWPSTVTSIYSNSSMRSLRNQSATTSNCVPTSVANSTATTLKPLPHRYPTLGFSNGAITEEPPSSDGVMDNGSILSSGDGAPSSGSSAPASGRSFGSDGKVRKKHKCFYCGRLYSRKYGLKIHIRTHTGFKPLNCKFCHRPFGDPSNLNKHIRLHAEGVTPYRCDLCGKVLVRRRDLDRHLKSRHPSTGGQKQVLDCESPSGEICRKLNLAAK